MKIAIKNLIKKIVLTVLDLCFKNSSILGKNWSRNCDNGCYNEFEGSILVFDVKLAKIGSLKKDKSLVSS